MSDSEEAREAAKSKPPKSISDPLSGTRDLSRTPPKPKLDSSKHPASAGGASASGLGATLGAGMSNPAVVPDAHADRDNADPDDAVGMRKALRQMGIRPPRPFDP